MKGIRRCQCGSNHHWKKKKGESSITSWLKPLILHKQNKIHQVSNICNFIWKCDKHAIIFLSSSMYSVTNNFKFFCKNLFDY